MSFQPRSLDADLSSVQRQIQRQRVLNGLFWAPIAYAFTVALLSVLTDAALVFELDGLLSAANVLLVADVVFLWAYGVLHVATSPLTPISKLRWSVGFVVTGGLALFAYYLMSILDEQAQALTGPVAHGRGSQ